MSAIVNGAAVDTDRDGTPLVHRPDRDEPVPATLDESEPATGEPDRYSLEELSARNTEQKSESASHSHDDEAFAALVAE